MKLKDKFNINDLMYEANIADLLCKEDLATIGGQISKDFDNDLMSRSSWEKRTETSLKLALQVAETKNFPWANASNVKFPLITIAALQYHARSYPVLVDRRYACKVSCCWRRQGRYSCCTFYPC
jgi:chaperonin GroES